VQPVVGPLMARHRGAPVLRIDSGALRVCSVRMARGPWQVSGAPGASLRRDEHN
jgi:hypothetical protein